MRPTPWRQTSVTVSVSARWLSSTSITCSTSSATSKSSSCARRPTGVRQTDARGGECESAVHTSASSSCAPPTLVRLLRAPSRLSSMTPAISCAPLLVARLEEGEANPLHELHRQHGWVVTCPSSPPSPAPGRTPAARRRRAAGERSPVLNSPARAANTPQTRYLPARAGVQAAREATEAGERTGARRRSLRRGAGACRSPERRLWRASRCVSSCASSAPRPRASWWAARGTASPGP